jgi:magnesium chelatase subunit D
MVTNADKDFIASQPRRALRFSQAGVCMTTTEAMERAMAVAGEMTAADESDGERSRQSAAFTDLNSGPATFPLAAVVGQEAIKTALLLCGVNPKIGGVVISGSRGTAKSVMARAIHKLLPPIEVIKGNQFNSEPASGEYDSFLEEQLRNGELTMDSLETEVVPAPFVQVPLDVLEDRLLGAVDVEKSVKTGNTIFEPGLLAKAHRGVLYVDDINLLDESISNLLLEALSTGTVTVEREGLSVRHPCRPLLIATFNPEENELRPHLMDRIGICLSADAVPLNEEERLEAVNRALDFANSPQAVEEQFSEVTEEMKTSVIFAREYLKNMKAAPAQIKYLCEEAIRSGVQGNRGELFAIEVARAAAALSGNDRVEADDLQTGVKLCIAPRGTEIQLPPDDLEEMMAPPPPPPPPPNMEDEEEKEEEEAEQEEQEEQETDEAPAVPEEFMFDVEGVALDPDVMKFATKAKSGRSGSRGLIFSEERGRYIKPILPKGRVRKLAVDATMRTAAPYQARRRERAAEAKGVPVSEFAGRVFIEGGDVRAKKMARKAGSLVVFVVDASGSMALNRMNAAKGAAINLLGEAYQSRDKICLISFQGDFAQVLLPPTRSIAMAKNRLERMPCGGGSPLAHALNQAAQVGMTSQKTGDVGEVLVVCISDGRANVPLAVATDGVTVEEAGVDKAGLKEEVMNTAKMLGSLPNFKLLMLDTENKFVSTGLAKEIAQAAQGKYHYIPKGGANAVTNVASAAIADLRG